MRSRNQSPYFTTARFPSVCPETGKPIRRGDPIAYYPAARKAFHDSAPSAAQLREQNFNRAFCMADAEW